MRNTSARNTTHTQVHTPHHSSSSGGTKSRRLAPISRAVLDFLYPRHCVACDRPLRADAEYLCPACWRRLPVIERARCWRCSCPPADDAEGGDGACPNCHSWAAEPERVLAWARFDDVTPDLVHQIKFSGKRRLARALGRRMAGCEWLRDELDRIDALVPVPLHPTRLRERGYNQSLCLARGLAEGLAKPLLPDLVGRVRSTQQQARLDGQVRQANVQGAFQAHGQAPADCRIGLVDDVSTMGATIGACARALKAAGVRSVWGVVVASAFKRG